jgi:hypothetical protein
MKSTVLVAALGLFAPSYALLRFGCSQLTVQRLDPLVNPGQNPSPHLHQYVILQVKNNIEALKQ